MAKTSPSAFVAQVRSEASKVVWPTRKETFLTTVMVLALSAVVAIFFFFVDQLLGLGVEAFLDIRF
ncbi:MAG: preprotein translocase subunit SecE [Rhodobacteraceae bacterium]|nr:preprotein translocase subunit SecE [Paracoccaceae bacterium]